MQRILFKSNKQPIASDKFTVSRMNALVITDDRLSIEASKLHKTTQPIEHSNSLESCKIIPNHQDLNCGIPCTWRFNWLKFTQPCIHLMILVLLSCFLQNVYATTSEMTTPKYSQLLSTNGQMMETADVNGEDTFRPFIPNDPEAIARTVFTPTGQFHVFQPVETDLRATINLGRSSHSTDAVRAESSTESTPQPKQAEDSNAFARNPDEHLIHNEDESLNSIQENNDLTSDLRSLEDLLVEYVQNFFEKGEYKPMPGLIVELQSNRTNSVDNSLQQKSRHTRNSGPPTGVKISLDSPRTLSTGRVLFLTGLKKILWPVFMGLQVLKSLLIAMFIPAIIGSFTKLLGKGISQGSAPLFIRPMDPPQELDFRDNFGGDSDKFVAGEDGLTDFMPSDHNDHKPYAYNQPEASQYSNQYSLNSVSPNSQLGPLSFTRLGMNERQHQLMQDSYLGALQTITSASFKNSNSISGSSSSLSAPMVNKPPAPANVNTFQQFQKVPASSLLLSNYDPFYSPLLSRLDSVFAQLKLNSDNEDCREKVICLMYANPAKYAPYSNLVSAQLSRELNELRKPTSDNPDILRFFKYMRAAKDGQDGVDCERTFDKCTEFKDFENPAMVSTYHDINKLVQARKMT
ncbi:protein Osi24 [Haematobia irritans]|uniref:protein Osi24 n=1 Tax=Haematobia irritans TaxID=7368 RepID=UPI003F4FF492